MSIINLLKIVSDENRLRILNIIKENQLCVGEIQTLLNINQSNASRHLEKIKTNGIVTINKKAQFVFYQLSNNALIEYPFLKQLLFEDIKNIPIFIEDLNRLKKYKASGLCCQDLRNAGFDYKKLKL